MSGCPVNDDDWLDEAGEVCPISHPSRQATLRGSQAFLDELAAQIARAGDDARAGALREMKARFEGTYAERHGTKWREMILPPAVADRLFRAIWNDSDRGADLKAAGVEVWG